MDYYVYIIAFLAIVLVYLLLRQRKVENNITERFEESLGKTNKHLGNAHTNMGKTMQSFNNMRSYFSSISGLEVENENNGL